MKILLIEDELEMSSVAVAQLTKLGHTVITAHNLRDAYLRYTEHKESLDLIIADHRLPDGPGVDFILDISYTEDQAKLAIVSGCLTGTDRRLLDERGIPFYLKPVLYSKVANDFAKKITPKAGAPVLGAEDTPAPVSLEMPGKSTASSLPSQPREEEQPKTIAPVAPASTLKSKLLSSLTMTDSVEAMESAPTMATPLKAKQQVTMPPFGRKVASPLTQPKPEPVQAPIPAVSSPPPVEQPPTPAIPTQPLQPSMPKPSMPAPTLRPMGLRKQATPSFQESTKAPPPVAVEPNPATLRPTAPPPGLVKSIGGGPISTGGKAPPPPGKPVIGPGALLIPPPPPPPEEKPKGFSRLFGGKK